MVGMHAHCRSQWKISDGEGPADGRRRVLSKASFERWARTRLVLRVGACRWGCPVTGSQFMKPRPCRSQDSGEKLRDRIHLVVAHIWEAARLAGQFFAPGHLGRDGDLRALQHVERPVGDPDLGASPGPLPIVIGGATRRAPGSGPARSGPCRTRRRSRRSASCWQRVPATVRATARSGCGCASPTSAPPSAASVTDAGARLAAAKPGRASARPEGHDGTIRTERVDTMWGTDLTSTLTGEGQAASSSPSITPRPSAWASTLPAARPGSKRSSRSARPCGTCLVPSARPPPTACSCATTTAASSSPTTSSASSSFFLGIASSPAFAREPEGNGSGERFIWTLKGGPALGASLRHHRGAAPGPLRLQGQPQPDRIVERHGYQTPAAVIAAQLAPLPAAA